MTIFTADLARAILRAADRGRGLLYRSTAYVDMTGDPPRRVRTKSLVEFGDAFPNAEPTDKVFTAAQVKSLEPDAWAFLQGGGQ